MDDHLSRWRVENEVEAGGGSADLVLIGTDLAGVNEARRIAAEMRDAGVQFAALALTGRAGPITDVDGFDMVAMSDGAEALAMACHMLMPIASLICWDMGDVRRLCAGRIMTVTAAPRSGARAAIFHSADDPAVEGVMFWAHASRLAEIDDWYTHARTHPRGGKIDHLFGSDDSGEDTTMLVGRLYKR